MTKKPKPKTIRFADPVFLRAIVVAVGPPSHWAKVGRQIKITKSEIPTDGTAWHLRVECEDGRLVVLVLLPPFDYTVDWYDSLIHEMSHAVDYTFDVKGIPPGLASTELRAYLNGFYCSTVLRGLSGQGPLRIGADGRLLSG